VGIRENKEIHVRVIRQKGTVKGGEDLRRRVCAGAQKGQEQEGGKNSTSHGTKTNTRREGRQGKKVTETVMNLFSDCYSRKARGFGHDKDKLGCIAVGNFE
jgi:hypothetical protein